MIGSRLNTHWQRLTAGIDSAALAPWWLRARGWWLERSRREQLLIAGLAVVAGIALVLVAVIVPLRSIRAAAGDELHNAAILDAQLRAGGVAPGQHAAMRRGTPSAILTDTAAAARLVIARIEPEGGNTRIELGDAPFAQVLTWVADVERNSRLRVSQAQVDQKTPGVVGASFVFAG